MQRAALHSSVKQNPRIFLISQLNNSLPQPHRVRNMLQSLPQHPTLVLLVALQLRSLQPKLNRIGNQLNTPRNHRFGIFWISQPTSFKPNILILRALFAAPLNLKPSCLNLPIHLLNSSSSNPSVWILRIRLSQTLVQQPRSVPIVNLLISGPLHTLQISQVAFRIHNSLPRDRIRQPIKLQRQHRTSPLTNSSQVRHRSLPPRRLRTTSRSALRIQSHHKLLLLLSLLQKSIRNRHKALKLLLLVTQRVIPNLRNTIPLIRR